MFAVVVQCGFLAIASAQETDPFARWEPNIRAFEERDKASPPAPGGIVFVGSSTIVGWNLAKQFPDLPAINRGFGGSQMADAAHFADRIVTPYRPRMVVVYSGDNDVAAGKSPEQVAADFRAFLGKVRAALPETTVVFIPIKPSLARWKLVDKMRRANTLIGRAIQQDPKCIYADMEWELIGPDGKPRKELFKEDGLHLNERGYTVWSRVLRSKLGTGTNFRHDVRRKLVPVPNFDPIAGYLTPTSSTSKVSSAFGGIFGGEPISP